MWFFNREQLVSLIYIVCILHIDLTLMMESTARVSNCKTRDGCHFADSHESDIPQWLRAFAIRFHTIKLFYCMDNFTYRQWEAMRVGP